MSSAERVQVRPARWPWVVFSGFIAIAVVGTVFVAANDEPIGGQMPYVAAFSMFGAVGALILSRDPRNLIGRLLLYGLPVKGREERVEAFGILLGAGETS